MPEMNKQITRFCVNQTKVSWYRMSSRGSVAELKRNTHIMKREIRQVEMNLQF